MDEEKRKIKKEFKLLLKDPTAHRALYHDIQPRTKSDQQSSKVRAEGNKLYLEAKHNAIVHSKVLNLYNKSLALAPNDTEVQAAAYANKSALLRHFHRYSESISEIDKALKITQSDALRIKLFCRKAECLTALKSTENQKNLEEAKSTLSKLEQSENIEDSLKKLIEKTENVVRNGFSKMPKKDTTRAQKFKMIANVRNMDTSRFVKVNYSKDVGIHLVADRDFRIGEILHVEKPFCAITNATNHNISYLYCGHCHQYLWTCVPCDHCTWCLFCSEQCKNQAWEECHKVECRVISVLLKLNLFRVFPHCQLTLRVILESLRDAGSITRLRTDLHSVINDEDQNATISTIVQREGYKYLYSLPGNATPDEEKKLKRESLITLIALAKNSSTFGFEFNSDNINKLLKNDDAMFFGALFLRTCRIMVLNIQMSFIPDPDCKSPLLDDEPCRAQCCGKDAFIAPRASSIIVSCCPNVGKCSTFDNLTVVYALTPIKAGDKLYFSEKSVYNWAPIPERREIFRKRYGSAECSCPACEENWTDVFGDIPKESIEQQSSIADLFISFRDSIDESITDFDIQMLNASKKFLEGSWEHTKLPSKFIVVAGNHIMNFSRTVYGERPPEVPDKCA